MKFLAAFAASLATIEAFQVAHLSGTAKTRTSLPANRVDDENTSAAADRRAFLLGAAAATVASFSTFAQPSYAASGVDYKAVSADIAELVKKNPE